MAVKFHKLHSSGNDFLILTEVENENLETNLNKNFIEKICHRNLGIGADGIFYVFKKGEIKHFDPDGSESFCVNGSLCLAYLKKSLDFIPDNFSLNGVGVSIVSFEPAEISFALKLNLKEIKIVEGVKGLFVDIGNPHFFIEGIEPDKVLAEKLRNSKEFENGANISFFRKLNEKEIEIATYERGVENFTLACGSACAAFCMGYGVKECVFHPMSKIPLKVKVNNETVFISGKVEYVAKGFYFN